MKVNNQKLEKDYNKLGKAYHEMEDRIKVLEGEKQNLEEEVNNYAFFFMYSKVNIILSCLQKQGIVKLSEENYPQKICVNKLIF